MQVLRCATVPVLGAIIFCGCSDVTVEPVADSGVPDGGRTVTDGGQGELDGGSSQKDVGGADSGGSTDVGESADGSTSGDGGHDASSDTGMDAGSDAGGPDAGVPFGGMLAGASGGTLVKPGGGVIEFSGAISCCGGAYGWPIFDEAWVDYVSGKGVNFLHARLGPFLTGSGGESDWAATGGGYADVGGKADLTAWNGAFWSRVRALIEYAGDRGLWVEVDIADGWGIKHCRWGDTPGYSPWDAAWNVQGEDWCNDGGSREIIGDDVHERWVRKVVEETGRYGNVIFQDGNEIGIVGGYAPEWTLSIRNIVRDEEQKRGYPRHLLGTNSGDDGVLQAVGIDYAEFHRDTAADPAQCHGKPCLVNEYNPNPPMTPVELFAQYCAARAAGTYFWYWRHGQTQQQMDQTLGLIAGGCR